MVYSLYREQMDQIRDGSIRELQIALIEHEVPAVGDVLTFVDRFPGPRAADPLMVTIRAVHPAGEDRGFQLWRIVWE